nr:TMAO reductase system sensor histidine kinase/response regulator TorS [Shewanella sp. SM74]
MVTVWGMNVGVLSLSGKSLVSRLMFTFCILGLLLLLLVSLGSLSLYWVKLADEYLYEKALPASEAARQLMQSSNGLLDNAQGLERVEEEAQRAYIGRKLSIESTNLLTAIDRLNSLNVHVNGTFKDKELALFAGEIIHELSMLGRQVGERLALTHQLNKAGRALTEAASKSNLLLEAELAVVDSAILAKLSLAYPQVAGNTASAQLLDTIIEQDLDLRERLNRGLVLIHHIALVGQLLQSPEQQLGLKNVLASVPRELNQLTIMPLEYYVMDPSSDNGPRATNEATIDRQIDLMPLELLKGLVRDPVRAMELEHELLALMNVNSGLRLQQQYGQILSQQNKQLQQLTGKLSWLNKSVDNAMKVQQDQANDARYEFLQQLLWAKFGLWMTGILMLIIMIFVVYRVIYKGITVRLSEATMALSQLSQGNTEVVLDPRGHDELTAMASAIEAFKQKTAHNQALSLELQATASELFAHKASLESTVLARTMELAEANSQLDAEAKGHSAAREMAEQASKAKSLFLATMSHEIRTPLNGLLGTLTLLGHSPLPPAQKQMLALSQYSGTLLQTVLNDILDFSRLEQGKLTNEPRPVALNELLDKVVAIMLAGAGLSGLSLSLVKENLPEWVNLDGPKLRQVLFNLLGNAIKFTQKGDVELRVFAVDQQLHFEIMDTGVGINESVMGQLFVAYSAQPNQGRTRGTGLGLAICKELVALMNNVDTLTQCIWVQSQVAKGSTFGFSLPLTLCQQVDRPSPAVLPKVLPKCILVIEDNKVNAMIAQGFLAHLGHQSILAESCAEARALYRQDNASHFDGILLDIQLSDGSGLVLLPELKLIASKAHLEISVMAFTAQVQDEDIKAYQTSGFDGVLEKPLNMDSLALWVGVASGEQLQPKVPPSEEQSISDLGSTLGFDISHGPLLNELQINQDVTYLGSAALWEMLELFKMSSTEQIRLMEEQNNDPGPLLHALKGSSASLGLVTMYQLCKQLEDQGIDKESYLLLVKVWQASMSAFEEKLNFVS